MRNVCFPAVKRTFSRAETYVSREENIENVGSFWKKCACGANFPGLYLSCRLRKSRLLWWTGDSVPCVFGRFSGFRLPCRKISGRIFPCLCCFFSLDDDFLSVPFMFHPQVPSCLLYVYLSLFSSACAYTCARTCPREIHNVGLFSPIYACFKKCTCLTSLFPAIYKKSSKIPQKSIA